MRPKEQGVDRDKIQSELLKLNGGDRLLRLTEPQSGVALAQRLDPRQAVARQKEKLLEMLDAALERATLTST